MNVSEIINYWDYPCETYTVVTDDGYILSLYRIPHGKMNSSNLGPKPVVYLQHGTGITASIWVANPPDHSLPFLLAEAGFEVWMGTNRGNSLPKNHLYLNTDSREFWNFSLDEMIRYDLPTFIDFILKKTGQKQIYYVGVSQGTYLAFAAFATNPQLAQKVKMYFALAPIATLQYTSVAFKALATLEPLYEVFFGEKDVKLNPTFCSNPAISTLCNAVYIYSLVNERDNINQSRVDVYMSEPSYGTSVRTLRLIAQAINTGVFKAYDWGNSYENILHYNQSTPPLYKLENVNVRTALWSGEQDVLATPKDVQNLESKLPNVIYHKILPHYGHNSFTNGLDAPLQIYIEIIALIKKDQSG
ncbi:alpha/beta fold hydrolase [Salmonella enterica]|nr:alpha/beta fold hydrolase [Salmonella enterica]